METTAEENSEEVLCPSCMRGNAEGAHFCGHCGAPLDAFAATDPMGSIYARFDTLGKASRGPRNGVVLVGMWLIMGPIFVTMFYATFVFLLSLGEAAKDLRSLALAIFSLLISGIFTIVAGILLKRTTWNYFRKWVEAEDEKDDELSKEALAAASEGEGGDVGGLE